jgi:transposase
MADGTDAKLQFLKSRNTLHRHPQHVRDPLFADSEFFDPRDLVQVRYELLRRHRVDGQPVAGVARAFGVSRQLFYLLDEAFQAQGLQGLLPRKRGPKQARKCSRPIVQFLDERRGLESPVPWSMLAKEVQDRFGVRLHARSLQRALAAGKKTLPAKPATAPHGRKPEKKRPGATRRSGPRR